MSEGGNQTSSQTAYEQTLQMILTRKIRSGEKLTEERLTDLLGVSRTPVREAIRKLADEGMVVAYPFTGVGINVRRYLTTSDR
jgi:DNA-binding GntR family transcriptional regulator